MRPHGPTLTLLLALLLFAPAKGSAAMRDLPADLPLIPAPASWRPDGGRLAPTDLAVITVPQDRPAALRLAELFAGWWVDAGGPALPVVAATEGPAAGAIVLELLGEAPDRAPTVPGAADESHTVTIAGDGITVSAAGPAGLHRGLQTLRQFLLCGADRAGELPTGRLEGRPRFRWRGMLLDSGRHLQDVPFIKQLIDELAFYGFNVLHWHLTEDQGWRLEVPAHPLLTEIGAWRDDGSGGRYGGFYSAEDVREIVAFAADRFVTVIPEIELPGHAKAALAAYPELSCSGGPFAVETQWGIHEDVFCAGNEDVFALLGDVFDRVVELFPAAYVHIGGDEVPKDRWLACPRCRQRLVDEGLAGVHELQSWFVHRAEAMLAARGRRLIGWDEILEGGLPATATVQSWRGTRGAVAAARAGNDAVVSPTSHAYFDYDPGLLPLEKVLTFDPVPAELEQELAGHILGGEMNLWTEYIPQERVRAMLYPRLTAMAEALGAPRGPRDLPGFLARVRRHERIWRRWGITAGPASRPTRVGLVWQGATPTRYEGRWAEGTEELLGGYGGVPRAGWSDRPSPVSVRPQLLPDRLDRDTATVFSWLHSPELGGDRGRYGAPDTLEVNRSLAFARPVNLAHRPSSRFPGQGPFPLTDGLRGGRFFDDGRWTGFEAHDLRATIDLGRTVAVTDISLRAVQDANAWVFLPPAVRFEGSEDGERWFDLGTAGHDVPDREQAKTIREFLVEVGRPLRHLRVTAANFGVCPRWHPGRGEACWLFVDEIRVR